MKFSMKKKLAKSIIIAACLVLSALMLTACDDGTNFTSDEILSDNCTRSTDVTVTYNYEDGAVDTPSSYNIYSSEITDFELKLFRNCIKGRDDNSGSFVIAPINTSLQLGLIANGASNDTRKEIINVLGDDLSLDIINQSSSYFKSRIQSVANAGSDRIDELTGEIIKSDSTSYVKLSDTLLVNDTSDIKTKFLQSNADYYGSDIFRFDFGDENATVKLAAAFADYSDNAPVTPSSSDTFVSLTASDICDSWLDAYAKTDIEQGTFSSSQGDTTVSYMTSNESYMQTGKATGIVKYMSKTPLKLVLVLPNEKYSLEEYISNFSYLEYSDLLDSIDFTKRATAKIPEFSINSDSEAADITSSATSSGLYTLFTKDAAFTNMTSADGFIFNSMYELTPKITVNAAGIGGRSENDDSHVISARTKELDKTDTTIEFNRPFIFMIIDNESSIPLYIGTVDITE